MPERRARASLRKTLAIALAVVAARAPGALGAATAAVAPAPSRVPSAPSPVLVFGIDGADFAVLDPLLAAGRLPHLARLVREGYASPLRSFTPTFSPVLWTSIATGVTPERHGVTHFITHGSDGAIVPVTSTMRRRKALWNVASEGGRTVGVFGWWITWPAERVNGVLVSSYAGLRRGEAPGGTIKGGYREALPEETWPPDFAAAMRTLLPAARREGEAAARRVFAGSDPARLNAVQNQVVADSRETLVADAVFQAAAERVLGERIPDLTLIYAAGLDVLSHRFWKYRRGEAAGYRVSAAERRMLGAAIDRYAEVLDARLGRLLRLLPAHATVVVLSDHGFHAARVPGKDEDQVSGHHLDAPPGILVVRGPEVAPVDARRRVPADGPSVLDIAPTVLHLVRLPVPRDLDGSPVPDLLRADALASRPVARIDSFETAPDPGAPARPSALDAELEERLRSLGYIQ